MKKKPLRQWVKENRAQLDRAIRVLCPNLSKLNDDDRRLWVLNNEGLYLWAKGERVNV